MSARFEFGGATPGSPRLAMISALGLLLMVISAVPAVAQSSRTITGTREGVGTNDITYYSNAGVLFSEAPADGTGYEVAFFRFQVPAGVTFTSARLDFDYWQYSGAAHPITFTSLGGPPSVNAAGINTVRSASGLGSVNSNAPGVLTLSASVLNQLNSLSSSGGGTLFVGAWAPQGTPYFGEFTRMDLAATVLAPVLDLGLAYTGSPRQGGQFGLSVSLSNSGDAPTSGAIALAGTLPAGLTLNSHSGAGWACSGSGNLQCTRSGAIAAGGTGNLSLTLSAASDAQTPRDILLTASGGGASAADTASVSVPIAKVPALAAVSPEAGPTTGGTTVTLTGTNFTGVSGPYDVQFNGVNAVSYTVNSDTSLTAVTPAGAAGTVNVNVINAGNSSANVVAARFTYVSPPTVTAVSPGGGSPAGGNPVIITGSNLSGATAVTFGGTPATGYTINSATQITATAPAVSAGTVNVRVTTAGGTSATGAGNQYAFAPAPTASSFTYGSIVAYNDGAGLTTSIDVATGGNVQNNPTSYAVGSATTAQGGSVSINSSGRATYTPPVGYRSANDSFTFTASNGSGSSAARTVTVTIGDPSFSLGASVPSGVVGAAYNPSGTPLSITGGRVAYSSFSASGLSAFGLSINSAGVISGTPTTTGTAAIVVTVTDSSLGAGPYTGTVSFPLTVTLPAAPAASSFTSAAVAYNGGGGVATAFSAAAHATNSPTAYAVGSPTTANGGSVSINNAGLVTYTAPVGFRGNDSFTFTATNAGGTSNAATVTVPVLNPGFSITLPSATGAVGAVYNPGGAAVSVSGGRAPYGAFSASGLPAGLTMSSVGVISGTPTTATGGPVTVTVTLTDSSTGTGPFTATASASLTITAPTIAVSPGAGALPGAQAGVAYSQTFTSTGGYAPVTYAITVGSTPPGVTLASDGVLSGTPTATGTFSFTVTAMDSSGNAYTGSTAYSLTVSAPVISLAPATLPAGAVGEAYSQTLVASGGTAGYTYSLAGGTLPNGLTLSSAGILSGTPTEGGVFPITLAATDSTTGGTYSGARSYSLLIGAGVQTISFGPLSDVPLSAPSRTLSATASSGLAVSFTSQTSAVCSVSGTVVLVQQLGTCTIRAQQAGNASWTAATPVDQSFTVLPDQLGLAPSFPGTRRVGAAYSQVNTAFGGVGPYAHGLASGQLPPGTSVNAGTGEVSGVPTTAGVFTYVIRVTDSRSVTADMPPLTVTIAKGNQTIAFTSAAPSATVPGPDYQVTTSTPSGLAVSLTLDASSTGCVLSGATVSFTGAGTCVVNADQAGDANWNAAARVQQSFAVIASPPVAANLTGVLVAWNSAGTAINLSGSITGGAHASITVVSAPAHGSISISGDVVTYTPSTGYFGPDSFTYTATGPGGTSNTATVSLVVATPAAPVAANRSGVAVAWDSPGTAIDLSTSISGVYSSVAISTPPSHGTVTVSGSVATYRPTTGYYGPDSFSFTATGPGGTSAPATVSLTVANPPAPVVTPPSDPVVTPPSSGGVSPPVTVDLTAIATGVVDDIRVETDGRNGDAVITGDGSAANPWTLTYTPAANFMGTDTVSVIASGPGGDSAPANFTFQVAGKAPDLTASTASNASVTVSPTASLVGGPFSTVRITRAPAFGTATVEGLDIVFTPGAANGGATSLDYVIDLPFGASAPGRIDLVSNLVPGAQTLTATTLQGVPVTVRISDTVGGPFTASAVVSIDPADAGTATVAASGAAWDLTFTPAAAFSGEATVTFSLTNAIGTTNGTLAITVEARPDPSQDPDVRGVATAQITSARRLADAQLNNFQRRLQALHDGTNASSNGLSLNLGFGGQSDLDNDPRTALRRQLGVRDEVDPGAREDRSREWLGLDLWAGRETDPGTAGAATDRLGALPNAGGAQGEGGSSVGFWTAGSVDWGRQDAVGQRDYRFTTQGVTAGLDVRVGDSLILGGGLGYGEDKTRIGDNGSVSEGSALTGALYASWRPAEAVYVDGVIGYADLDFDARRWATGLGGQPDGYALSSRSGDVRFASAAVGRLLRGEGMITDLYARVDAREITLDGFTETGVGHAALVWDGVDQSSLSANLGAAWRWSIETRRYGRITPSARLEWSHELEDIGAQGVRYADWAASPTWLVPLDAWSRNAINIDLGAEWSLTDRLMFSLGYRGNLGDASTSHGGEVRVKYGW